MKLREEEEGWKITLQEEVLGVLGVGGCMHAKRNKALNNEIFQ